MRRRHPLEGVWIKEAIWEASQGFLGGSDRSHLGLEQLSWLLCGGWPRAVGAAPDVLGAPSVRRTRLCLLAGPPHSVGLEGGESKEGAQ